MNHTIFLFGLLCFCQHSTAKDSCVSSEFSLNGDYILGGLFPVHSAINNATFDFPVALECDRYGQLSWSSPNNFSSVYFCLCRTSKVIIHSKITALMSTSVQ